MSNVFLSCQNLMHFAGGSNNHAKNLDFLNLFYTIPFTIFFHKIIIPLTWQLF